MSTKRLGILQWVGLLVGAGVWWGQHLVGAGITQAECGAGGRHWGIANDVWEGTLMGVAALFVLTAAACAVTVLRETSDTSYEDDPPRSRLRFFAITALASNAIFLMIILLDGFASIFDVACRQS